jgi:hypothetical protein
MSVVDDGRETGQLGKSDRNVNKKGGRTVLISNIH